MEQFDVAAARHLVTADTLEQTGRNDDAAYHYGLVGETSIKAAVVRMIGGQSLPRMLREHLQASAQAPRSLQSLVLQWYQNAAPLASGRVGGAVLSDITSQAISQRFVGWSVSIRYADTRYPVTQAHLAQWEQDAVYLYNAGNF